MSNRHCSRRLQRVVTDFGADVAWAEVPKKIAEHYGIKVAESTARRVTFVHAAKIYERSRGLPQGLPEKVAPAQTFIAELDGTMVPTVRASSIEADKRKGKSVQWEEVKVALAHVQGSTNPVFAATLIGDVELAGKQLRACAKRAGFGAGHQVHGVGDGAPWIARQMKDQFGSQGSYLLDFYHVCEYLSPASKAIEVEAKACEVWLETQKSRLKGDGLELVLAELQANLELPGVPDEQAPVRQCHRYLSARRDQLDYAQAIKQGLPIGSGEVESAHRYVVQKRLKLPGAWWLAANAEHMLALRLNRANKEWAAYWSTNYRYAEAA